MTAASASPAKADYNLPVGIPHGALFRQSEEPAPSEAEEISPTRALTEVDGLEVDRLAGFSTVTSVLPTERQNGRGRHRVRTLIRQSVLRAEESSLDPPV